MSKTIIVKNNTVSDIKIEDLGVVIEASSSRNLSQNYELDEIYSSDDLKNFVSLSDMIINNGSEDLSVEDALEYIDFITKEVVGPHALNDHIDTSLDAAQFGDFIGYDSTSGWGPKALNPQTAEPPDETSGNMWIPEEDRMPYFYDIAREQWLTVNRSTLTFAKRDKADGIYLPIDGEGSVDFYYIPRAACVTSIYCVSQGGEDTKGFAIKTGTEDLYTFSYDNSLIWTNNNLEINIDAGTLLRVRVDSAGGMVKNTVLQLEIAWRYVPS